MPHGSRTGSIGLAILLLGALSGLATAKPNSAQAWIGVSIQALDRDRARDLELGPDARGVVLEDVVSDGPAATAGLAVDDVVTQVDGRSVRDASAFIRAVQRHEPGETARLTVLRRGGKARTIDVVLAERPESDAPRVLQLPRATRSWAFAARPQLGVEVTDLDPNLATYFDVAAGSGVLVTRVHEGSGAEAAGIQAGDVLQRVADQAVKSVEDLHATLADLEAGDRLEVVVRRHGAEKKLDVELGRGASWGDELRVLPAPGRYAFDGDLDALRRDLRDLKRDMEEMQRQMRGLQR